MRFTTRQSKRIEKYIKTVAEVLLLTATQNIAQRGYCETQEVVNKGNFLAILEMIAKHGTEVQKIMKRRQNAKYTSNTTQNEILECLANMVHDDIIEEVNECVLCHCQWNPEKAESFLDFQQATQLDAERLKNKITHCLERYGLEYKSNLDGQSYDWASVGNTLEWQPE